MWVFLLCTEFEEAGYSEDVGIIAPLPIIHCLRFNDPHLYPKTEAPLNFVSAL